MHVAVGCVTSIPRCFILWQTCILCTYVELDTKCSLTAILIQFGKLIFLFNFMDSINATLLKECMPMGDFSAETVSNYDESSTSIMNHRYRTGEVIK